MRGTLASLLVISLLLGGVAALFTAERVDDSIEGGLPNTSENRSSSAERSRAVTLPVEWRSFKMGVGPFPEGMPSPTWDAVMAGYSVAGQWGELTNYWPGIPWYEEEAALVGNATTRATIKALYTDNGLEPVFQTNFWSVQAHPTKGFGAWLDVPPDMDGDTTTMGVLGFRTRWVDHVRNISAEWKPAYYCLGNEINSFYNWHPDNADDFERHLPSLLRACYDAIKEVSPDTKVVLTFRLLELNHEDNFELLEMFDRTMLDIIAFTSYPSRSGNYDKPSDLPPDYYTSITDHTGTIPLAIAELGWTSHEAFGGDPDEQADFLLWFLEHTRDMPWEYVQWLELHDLQPEGAATSHAQAVGLIATDGAPRPGWEHWKDMYNLTYTGDWPVKPHSPIWIRGDDDFTVLNGVLAGRGTWLDPYIIERWDINGSDEKYCLIVSNVSVFFVVRECQFHGKSGFAETHAITLQNTTHATFYNNIVSDSSNALYLDKDTAGNTFHHNDFLRCDDSASDFGTDNRFNDSNGVGNHWEDYVERYIPGAVHDGTSWSEPYVVNDGTGVVDDHPRVHRFGYKPMDVGVVYPPDNHHWPIGSSPIQVRTTGDPFNIGCWPSDRNDVARAMLRLWQGNKLLEEPYIDLGSNFRATFNVPSDSLEDIGFIFIIEDLEGNRTYSIIGTAEVRDNDDPRIMSVTSPANVTVGETIVFAIEVMDNIGLEFVWLEHWFDGGKHVNTTIGADRFGIFRLEMEAPGSLATLHYVVHASDASQNRAHSEEGNVTIIDEVLPWFGLDLSGKNGTTGDPFRFMVEAFDNADDLKVIVDYWFGDGEQGTADLSLGTAWSLIVTCPPDYNGVLLYVFRAVDVAGNENITQEMEVPVYDDDLPELALVTGLPEEVGTGRRYEVVVQCTDNVALNTTHLIHRQRPAGGVFHDVVASMAYRDGFYRTTIEIQPDSADYMLYSILVTDTSENTAFIIEIHSTVVDVIPPEVQTLSDVTLRVGEALHVEVHATDNYEVVGYQWSGAPFQADGSVVWVELEEEGTYEIVVTVFDERGNEDSTTFVLTVRPKVEGAAAWFLNALLVGAIVVVLVLIVSVVMWFRRRDRSQDG